MNRYLATTTILTVSLFLFLLTGCEPDGASGSTTSGEIDYAGTTGPENGSLVVVGGAMRDPAIFERFMELAGGPESHIVVIPTAMADSISDERLERVRQQFAERGVGNLTVLHTKDRELADSEEFVEPITRADGVWFTGGRQWRIVDSYIDTRTQREFEAVLERGGVIGGSSAGATIQGSYLARGDTKSNTIMMGDHEVGFGYIRNVAIDQHLLQRNRQFDLVEVIEAKPNLLGIGLDENTAIVVQGNILEVIGESFVAVYDHQRWAGQDGEGRAFSDRPFFLLHAGQKFDMQSRRILIPDSWD